MDKIINIVEIILAVLLIAVILMQQKGTGLGSAFGGGGQVYYQKRGFEKWLFRATIVLATAFLLLALVNMLFF